MYHNSSKNLAIANKPRDAATLFPVEKSDDLEMTSTKSLKVIENTAIGFSIKYEFLLVVIVTAEIISFPFEIIHQKTLAMTLK